MAIKCCYKCPDRWVKDGKTCHSTCERYINEKAQYEEDKKSIKANMDEIPNIKQFDFDKIAYANPTRRRKR